MLNALTWKVTAACKNTIRNPPCPLLMRLTASHRCPYLAMRYICMHTPMKHSDFRFSTHIYRVFSTLLKNHPKEPFARPCIILDIFSISERATGSWKSLTFLAFELSAKTECDSNFTVRQLHSTHRPSGLIANESSCIIHIPEHIICYRKLS